MAGREYAASVSHGVPVYFSACTGTKSYWLVTVRCIAN